MLEENPNNESDPADDPENIVDIDAEYDEDLGEEDKMDDLDLNVDTDIPADEVNQPDPGIVSSEGHVEGER